MRTIQRIEAREVNPRSYTVKIILEVLVEDFKNMQTYSSLEVAEINWTTNELKTLNKSWMIGVLYTVITLIGILMEPYFATNNTPTIWLFAFRIPYAILFFLTVFPLVNGYKLMAKNFKNGFLTYAIYMYIRVAICMTIITFFIKGSSFSNALEIVLSVFSMIIFGVGACMMGLGILKIKENLDSFAQGIGIIKIVNGSLLLTVIFSPIALFFVIPILILEVVFLHNTFKTAENAIINSSNL
ncbi:MULTISPECIES: hypothetical protein [unclassified Polaribacter]|uniref:hypothetical protein n=1 Tax=unclassified Polaribacter TaxID=196858 RepID=UPI0011BF69DF|nr:MULTISPECIES: hypothetical protein [unclassified Polaribacter]TXD51202.1 hypothetical protein ES043_13105 [Polaribacter sp. IC063]TXD59106.1 hypothetical protein ES044_10760 [Polaribacter sp. IC066]